MTPFQEFRLWARRAPANERISAAVATAIVLALLVWVLIPSSTGSNSASAFPGSTSSDAGTTGSTSSTAPGTSSAPGKATGPGAAGGPGASVPGTTSGTTSGGTTAGRGPGTTTSTTGSSDGTTTVQTDQGCQSPPASGPGVTDQTIKIAVII